MQFLATGKFIGEPDTSAHMPEERRVFDELRAEGVIQEVFFMQPGPGVVNVISAVSLEEARTQLARLPYVSLGFVEFDLVEVTRLP